MKNKLFKIFSNQYRLENPGYQLQKKRWWFPFWVIYGTAGSPNPFELPPSSE